MVKLPFDLLAEAGRSMDEVVTNAIQHANAQAAKRDEAGKRQYTQTQRAYQILNALWPKGSDRRMTDKEAKTAARVLYRKMYGEPFKGKLTVKHRGRSWMNKWRIIANSYQGWHDVIHDWSHDVHKQKYPNETAHGPHQAPIEREMVEEVVSRGWLNAAPEAKPEVKPDDFVVPPEDKVAAKAEKLRKELERTQAALKRWGTKAKRAETALKKLRRQEANLKKRLA